VPKIKLEHRTSLSASQIKAKAERLMRDALAQFQYKVSDAKYRWRGNRLFFFFRAMGFAISGEVVVRDGLILVEADLPFAAVFFEDEIRDKFDETARELFP